MPPSRARRGPLELPARAGFAPLSTGSHTGFSVASERVRPGPNVFGAFAWSWGAIKDGTFMAGKDAARLAAVFGWSQDPHGDYRMNVEVIWTFRYDTLRNIPDAEEVLGPKVWNVLRQYPDLVIVESNLGTVEEFSAYAGDVAIIMLHPDAEGEYDVPNILQNVKHRRGTRVCLMIGTITLKFKRNTTPVKVTSFRPVSGDDTLDKTLHEKFGSTAAVADAADIPPCAADGYGYDDAVPRRGGVEIGGEGGELLMAGCDEARMYVLEYKDGRGELRFATAQRSAVLDGSALHEGRPVVWATEVLDEAGLQRLVASGEISDDATKAQLQLPVADRQWLRGRRELVLGEKTVRRNPHHPHHPHHPRWASCRGCCRASPFMCGARTRARVQARRRAPRSCCDGGRPTPLPHRKSSRRSRRTRWSRPRSTCQARDMRHVTRLRRSCSRSTRTSQGGG